MFRFLPSSKHQPQSGQRQQDEEHNLVGDDDARVLSNAKSFETKLIPRGQSLLKKVIRRSRSSKSLSALKHFGRTISTGNNTDGDKHQDDQYEPNTPHQNHYVAVFPTLATPATALIHHGHDHPDTQIVKNDSAEQQHNSTGRHHKASSLFLKSKSGRLFSLTPTSDPAAAISNNISHDDDDDEAEEGDPVSTAILQEREKIRQQLFYEEQGVEVTAQFRQTSTATTTSAAHRSPFARKNRSRNEQEEKKEEAATATNIDSITTTNIVTPNKNYKGYSNDDSQMNNHSLTYSPAQTPETNTDYYHNKSVDTSSSPLAMSLPPTPSLNGLEADPVARFPAVAAAVAAKEIQELLHKAQLGNTHDFLTATTTTTATETATNNHADLSLFPSSAMVGLDTNVAAVTTAKIVSPSPERPFDEAGTGPEHPTVKEVENTTGKTTSTATTSIVTTNNNNAEGEDVTRKLLDVFNCGETPTTTSPTEFSSGSTYQIKYSAHPQHQEKGMQQKACRLVDAFYDNACWTYREAIVTKRPFYDEVFAKRFLKDITEEGVKILWHLPPSDEDLQDETSGNDENANWSGRSVVMKIKPGNANASSSNNASMERNNWFGSHDSSNSRNLHPKLVWTTLGGGIEDKVARCSVSLFSIQSISTMDNDDSLGKISGEEEVCLFAITTKAGDVQLFETSSLRERDLLVAGLKNVIARLAFHLIAGDASAFSALYCEDPPPGELPSCSGSAKDMNRIAHALMD